MTPVANGSNNVVDRVANPESLPIEFKCWLMTENIQLNCLACAITLCSVHHTVFLNLNLSSNKRACEHSLSTNGLQFLCDINIREITELATLM